MENTSVQNVLRQDLKKGLDTYKKAVGWMNWSFIVATALTAAEFVFGFFTTCLWGGNLIALILSVVSFNLDPSIEYP